MDGVKTYKFECLNCGKEIETDEFDSYTTEKQILLYNKIGDMNDTYT